MGSLWGQKAMRGSSFHNDPESEEWAAIIVQKAVRGRAQRRSYQSEASGALLFNALLQSMLPPVRRALGKELIRMNREGGLPVADPNEKSPNWRMRVVRKKPKQSKPAFALPKSSLWNGGKWKGKKHDPTPPATPVSTPRATPAATPFATPRATPRATPFSTQRMSPSSSPYSTQIPTPRPSATTEQKQRELTPNDVLQTLTVEVKTLKVRQKRKPVAIATRAAQTLLEQAPPPPPPPPLLPPPPPPSLSICR